MKALDIYLAFCFCMVFGALLEYATVSYSGKRIKMNQKRLEEFQRNVEEMRTDLAKKLNSLHAHFSALPKTLKTLTPQNGSGPPGNNNLEETQKMEGLAAKLKRRGWCGCLRDDEPPEITYCVVDGAGTLSLQAVTPSLPMPDEEELNAKFAELVVSYFYHFSKQLQII